MAKASEPKPVKHFCGMLAGDASLFTVAAERLAEQYGEIDAESEIFDFNFTDYYEKEMGPGLRKKFISFRPLIAPGTIVDIKLRTNELEAEIAEQVHGHSAPAKIRHGQTSLSVAPSSTDGDAKRLGVPRSNSFERANGEGAIRPINLDPGYLTLSKVVLATAKDYSHRLYLGRGIYAEVTLHYQKGEFVAWPWTYPDYKTEGYHAFFRKLREIYLAQLKNLGPLEDE
ncbi:MAG: DUF4416 family protein [Planctomycetota bacterium]